MNQHLLGKPLVSLVIAVGAFVAGCKSAPPPPPATFGPLPAQSFGRKWMADLKMGNDRVWQLHLGEESIFVYTDKHDVYQLSREGGALVSLAAVTSPARRLAPPVVLSDSIIFPTNTTLEIYEKTGRKIRSVALDFAMRSPAVGHDKSLYVGADYTGGARFVALDLDKAYLHVRWGFVTGGGLSAAPAMYKGQIFVGSENNRVYAVTEDRKPIWPLEGFAFETSGRILADVKADEFGVYVASTDSKLYCLDRSNGKVKWQYYSQQPLTVAPVVTATTVYQAVPNVGLVCLDKVNGKYNREEKWIAPGVVKILSEDAVNVYALLSDKRIVALDKNTGQERFASKRRDFSVYATNTKDATIFAATSNGIVYAITPVLKPGTVGELVLQARPLENLAAAN